MMSGSIGVYALQQNKTPAKTTGTTTGTTTPPPPAPTPLAAGKYTIQTLRTGTCKKFLSVNSCAGGPVIALWKEDDASGRQHFDVTAIVGSPNIYTVAVSQLGRPTCEKFMASTDCVQNTDVVSLANTDEGNGKQRWKILAVAGKPNTYTIESMAKTTCPGFLTSKDCVIPDNGSPANLKCGAKDSINSEWLFTVKA